MRHPRCRNACCTCESRLRQRHSFQQRHVNQCVCWKYSWEIIVKSPFILCRKRLWHHGGHHGNLNSDLPTIRSAQVRAHGDRAYCWNVGVPYKRADALLSEALTYVALIIVTCNAFLICCVRMYVCICIYIYIYYRYTYICIYIYIIYIYIYIYCQRGKRDETPWSI